MEFYWIYGENIRRTTNLTGSSTAVLSFDWQAISLGRTRALDVQISSNGGASYTSIGTVTGSTTNTFNQDITPYISANTTIRFAKRNENWNNDDFAYIDNFQISTTILAGPVIDDVVVNEDAGSAIFTVTHNDAATSVYNVNYSITAVFATEGVDYETGSGLYTGALNFNSTLGDTEQIKVNSLEDLLFEGNETFTIQFTSTSNGSVDITYTATGTINDNENDPNTTRPYEEKYALNLKGNYKVLSNTNLECVSNCLATPVTNNPSVVM